jgi:hypothetical protein
MDERNDDNVISMKEWLTKRLRKCWVRIPVPDPKEPSGYRWELVEAIPLPPMY